MVLAHARACALSVMSGNRRRNSTTADNSPSWAKMARIASAVTSSMANMPPVQRILRPPERCGPLWRVCAWSDPPVPASRVEGTDHSRVEHLLLGPPEHQQTRPCNRAQPCDSAHLDSTDAGPKDTIQRPRDIPWGLATRVGGNLDSTRARSERTDSIALPLTRLDVIHHGCWRGGQHA
jgi:hypothetical protein